MDSLTREYRLRSSKYRQDNTVKNDNLDWKMKCANRLCHDGKDLIPVIKKVCNYYHIKYKRNQKVCKLCFEKYLKHSKNLEKKMPNTVNGITIIKNKNTIENQDKLCQNVLNTSTETLTTVKHNINKSILESKKLTALLKYDLRRSYKPTTASLDLEELEKEESKTEKNDKINNNKEDEMDSENIIAVNTIVSTIPTDLEHYMEGKVIPTISKRGTQIKQSKQVLNRPFVEFIKDEEKFSNTLVQNIVRKSTRKKSRALYNNNDVLKIVNLSIPKAIPRPYTYVNHECNASCVEWTAYNSNENSKIGMLAIPLHFGFHRALEYFNGQQACVFYETPCGRIIRNIQDMHGYLITTCSKMTIDQFDFNSCVKPLAELKVLKSFNFVVNIHGNKEFRSISCVNSYSEELPPKIEYMTSRQPMPGVNLNVDSAFLCGCNCTDNCQDKSKCACFQMTIEGQNIFPKHYRDSNIGYDYRRLPERVVSGIYECNKTCKCSNSCLNRVVQHSLSQNLQLFLTEKKGWGVRCLNDVPKGSFICNYIGYIFTETDANEEGKSHGDEYLAELDYIETIEKIKNGFESDVSVNYQEDYDGNSSNDSFVSCKSSDGDYQSFSENEHIDSDAVILKHKHTETMNQQVNFSSQLNTHVNNVNNNSITPKSLREYFGNDESVYIVNAKTSGNIGRYLNHSCDPNLLVQNVFVDTHDLRFPWISFFAQKYIPAGTELTWDYNYLLDSVPGKVLHCHCKSSKCRKRLY